MVIRAGEELEDLRYIQVNFNEISFEKLIPYTWLKLNTVKMFCF